MNPAFKIVNLFVVTHNLQQEEQFILKPNQKILIYLEEVTAECHLLWLAAMKLFLRKRFCKKLVKIYLSE